MGMFETEYSFYFFLIIRIFSIFAVALYLTLYCEGFWAHMAGAFVMGCYWQQLAFLGHDLGHNAVSHNQTIDNLAGIVLGNMMGGISIAWWKKSHNVHHIVCNSIENDPDIQHLPIMAVDSRMMDGYYSTYHLKDMIFDKFCRWLVAYQHILYYPIMALARFNLYAQSWITLLTERTIHYRPLEIAALLVFKLWYFGLISTLPVSHMGPYLLLSHAVSGLLHVQITLSHFYMESYNGHPYTHNEKDDEWWRLQCKTTMDVDCYPWMDWFHGGLQF